jgi:hypothetical protein
MEGEPRNIEPGDGRPVPAEDLGRAAVQPGRARKIIEDGIEAAEAGNQAVEDWVARHIAWQLRDEDGSGFDVLARTGEVTDELTPEMMRAYVQAPSRRRWLEALEAYADQREDRGPVDGWAERGRIRDDFDAAWRDRDRDRERGNRDRQERELNREIRLAQEARQVIGDELAMRLLVRLASSPHGVDARFAADGRVTDELGQELQERYLSGTEQERQWLHELGSWITARGEPSPVLWWASPVPVEQPVQEHVDPEAQSERRVARLADLDERLAPLPDLGDIPRPPQGHRFGNGYEWMNEGLPEGWHPEPIWGRYGWDLGAWPLVVVALYIDDEHNHYAVAEYVEGDVSVKRYKSRGALYVAVNNIAEFHWRLGQSRGPRDLPEGRGLLAHHTGPYPGWSNARDIASGTQQA